MLADLVVLLHVLFVAFVVFGGLLALRWPRIIWLHVPAAVWGVLIEFTGWICPLTPLENRLREAAGESAYEGDFVGRYILPALYPEGLTRTSQLILGAVAMAINGVIYAVIFLARRSAEREDERRHRASI